VPFLLLFVQGYGYMSLLSVLPAIGGLRIERESYQS
jgi:hypothetical protein